MNKALYPLPSLEHGKPFWRGKRVGLFGGSFNPPHPGHKLIAREALKRFDLDCIWWMVSPKNPIKHTSDRRDFSKRLHMTTEFVDHPQMLVTDIEYNLNTPYSYKTVKELKKQFPKTNFLWIAGMDNAAVFHRWNDWRKLAKELPFVFFNRPPSHYKVQKSHLNMCPDLIHHYDERIIKSTPKPGHIYWVYTGHSKNISSSEIRNRSWF